MLPQFGRALAALTFDQQTMRQHSSIKLFASFSVDLVLPSSTVSFCVLPGFCLKQIEKHNRVERLVSYCCNFLDHNLGKFISSRLLQAYGLEFMVVFNQTGAPSGS